MEVNNIKCKWSQCQLLRVSRNSLEIKLFVI